MVNSVAEFHDVLEDLQKTRALKAVVWNIIKLYQHLERARSAKSQSAYLDAAYSLLEFENIFKQISTNHTKDIAILCTLKTEFYVTKEDIIFEMGNIWKRNVLINSQVEGKNKKFVTVSVKGETAGFEEVLRALHLLNNLRPVLRAFGKQFLTSICEVLILNNVNVNINENATALTINILNEQSPQPSEVFKSLTTVLQFIYDELFIVPVMNEDGTEVCTMREFGSVIYEDFCTLIIEKCLKVAIPKQSNQLEAFRQEIDVAENFSNSLHTMQFCIKSSNSLLNFIKNVDILPVNKMAQVIFL